MMIFNRIHKADIETSKLTTEASLDDYREAVSGKGDSPKGYLRFVKGENGSVKLAKFGDVLDIPHVFRVGVTKNKNQMMRQSFLNALTSSKWVKYVDYNDIHSALQFAAGKSLTNVKGEGLLRDVNTGKYEKENRALLSDKALSLQQIQNAIKCYDNFLNSSVNRKKVAEAVVDKFFAQCGFKKTLTEGEREKVCQKYLGKSYDSLIRGVVDNLPTDKNDNIDGNEFGNRLEQLESTLAGIKYSLTVDVEIVNDLKALLSNKLQDMDGLVIDEAVKGTIKNKLRDVVKPPVVIGDPNSPGNAQATDVFVDKALTGILKKVLEPALKEFAKLHPNATDKEVLENAEKILTENVCNGIGIVGIACDFAAKVKCLVDAGKKGGNDGGVNVLVYDGVGDEIGMDDFLKMKEDALKKVDDEAGKIYDEVMKNLPPKADRSAREAAFTNLKKDVASIFEDSKVDMFIDSYIKDKNWENPKSACVQIAGFKDVFNRNVSARIDAYVVALKMEFGIAFEDKDGNKASTTGVRDYLSQVYKGVHEYMTKDLKLPQNSGTYVMQHVMNNFMQQKISLLTKGNVEVNEKNLLDAGVDVGKLKQLIKLSTDKMKSLSTDDNFKKQTREVERLVKNGTITAGQGNRLLEDFHLIHSRAFGKGMATFFDQFSRNEEYLNPSDGKDMTKGELRDSVKSLIDSTVTVELRTAVAEMNGLVADMLVKNMSSRDRPKMEAIVNGDNGIKALLAKVEAKIEIPGTDLKISTGDDDLSKHKVSNVFTDPKGGTFKRIFDALLVEQLSNADAGGAFKAKDFQEKFVSRAKSAVNEYLTHQKDLVAGLQDRLTKVIAMAKLKVPLENTGKLTAMQKFVAGTLSNESLARKPDALLDRLQAYALNCGTINTPLKNTLDVDNQIEQVLVKGETGNVFTDTIDKLHKDKHDKGDGLLRDYGLRSQLCEKAIEDLGTYPGFAEIFKSDQTGRGLRDKLNMFLSTRMENANLIGGMSEVYVGILGREGYGKLLTDFALNGKAALNNYPLNDKESKQITGNHALSAKEFLTKLDAEFGKFSQSSGQIDENGTIFGLKDRLPELKQRVFTQALLAQDKIPTKDDLESLYRKQIFNTAFGIIREKEKEVWKLQDISDLILKKVSENLDKDVENLLETVKPASDVNFETKVKGVLDSIGSLTRSLVLNKMTQTLNRQAAAEVDIGKLDVFKVYKEINTALREDVMPKIQAELKQLLDPEQIIKDNGLRDRAEKDANLKSELTDSLKRLIKDDPNALADACKAVINSHFLEFIAGDNKQGIQDNLAFLQKSVDKFKNVTSTFVTNITNVNDVKQAKKPVVEQLLGALNGTMFELGLDTDEKLMDQVEAFVREDLAYDYKKAIQHALASATKNTEVEVKTDNELTQPQVKAYYKYVLRCVALIRSNEMMKKGESYDAVMKFVTGVVNEEVNNNLNVFNTATLSAFNQLQKGMKDKCTEFLDTVLNHIRRDLTKESMYVDNWETDDHVKFLKDPNAYMKGRIQDAMVRAMDPTKQVRQAEADLPYLAATLKSLGTLGATLNEKYWSLSAGLFKAQVENACKDEVMQGRMCEALYGLPDGIKPKKKKDAAYYTEIAQSWKNAGKDIMDDVNRLKLNDVKVVEDVFAKHTLSLASQAEVKKLYLGGHVSWDSIGKINKEIGWKLPEKGQRHIGRSKEDNGLDDFLTMPLRAQALVVEGVGKWSGITQDELFSFIKLFDNYDQSMKATIGQMLTDKMNELAEKFDAMGIQPEMVPQGAPEKSLLNPKAFTEQIDAKVEELSGKIGEPKAEKATIDAFINKLPEFAKIALGQEKAALAQQKV